MKRRDDWVVTYRMECDCGVTIMEFYRGTRAECIRIRDHSAMGEHDGHCTEQPWGVVIGPAASWDEFLETASQMPGVEPVTLEEAA